MEKKEKEGVNDRIAETVTKITGNMWFFWASLAFILILRISHPPTTNELLLNIENDLQLLLLAANAVVSGKQTAVLIKILKQIKQEEDTTVKELKHKSKQ